MKILEVELTTTNLAASTEFYRDLLGLTVTTQPEGIVVDIGSSRLRVRAGAAFDGVHHLAFGISPLDFDSARRWLRQRTELITVAGSDIIDGPEGWDSRSLYFRGPEGILLELIARQADRAVPGSADETPRLLSISEVGIGVPDVRQTVRHLAEAFEIPPFPPQLPGFAPVGSHDGLLILANSGRIWFPTEQDIPATGPLSIHIESATHSGKLTLTDEAVVQCAQTQPASSTYG
ncbi:VOC family protein [Nocardia aobensis]|uniref:VOC family protein n=1 Tax=Nocardia aobensis TaxID=257277 RepID=UPI0002D2E7A4|nr:VOC family protein [Nocardia aobensis]